MKKQAWMLAATLAVAVALVGYQRGLAAAREAIQPARIGVVDVTAILENSQKHKDWQQKMKAQEEQIRSEFQTRKSELDKLKANIDTRKPGSPDYAKFMEEYAQKKALLEAKNGLYEDQITAQMQQWTESLYQDFLKVVAKVAEQKGLDMVLAREGLDLPAPSLRDFMLTVKTNKVLYTRSELDITEDVLKALDNE